MSFRRGLELASTTRFPASLLNSGVASANGVTASGRFVDILKSGERYESVARGTSSRD